ncbi:unnamed protein product, partial [Cuscuta europaea]
MKECILKNKEAVKL